MQNLTEMFRQRKDMEEKKEDGKNKGKEHRKKGQKDRKSTPFNTMMGPTPLSKWPGGCGTLTSVQCLCVQPGRPDQMIA